MLKQEKAYGCGVFAIANACNLPIFITEERLEISKNGNNIGQLSKWLQQHGYDWFLDPIFFTHEENHGSPEVIKQLSVSKHVNDQTVLAFPLLLSLKKTENSLTHMIAIDLIPTGDLMIFDSLKEKEYFSTFETIWKENYSIYAVYMIADINTNKPVLMFENKSVIETENQ